MGSKCDKYAVPVEVDRSGVFSLPFLKGKKSQPTAAGELKGTTVGAPVTRIFSREERTIDSRKEHPRNPHTMMRPIATHGIPWQDANFEQVIKTHEDKKLGKISWRRPQDYCKNVTLFGNDTNRFSVNQGHFGDCFLMSTLSAIADQSGLLRQIMPHDAYETDPIKYTGVFHCRLWWMGEWIDVYTDDQLPYNDRINRVLGGHSEDNNIVWVTLMEKAMARLCGSYEAFCCSGDQFNAYSLLTGGLVQTLKIIKREESEDKDEILPPETVFKRVEMALKSGSAVLISIDEKLEDSAHLKGLVANHAYMISTAIKVPLDNKMEMLFRIRNPWGERDETKPANSNGEWKGRWSHNSVEWKRVDKSLREKYNISHSNGGEFWVCLNDFCKIFEHVHIADTIPHFDEEGFRKEDRLNKVVNILGEWNGETAAGNEATKKFKNPRFILTVPSHGLRKNQRMPIVLQIIQQYNNPFSEKEEDNKTELLYCRIDVYRILKEEIRNNQLYLSLSYITKGKTYMRSRETASRHRLSDGKYLLVPNYLERNARLPVSRSFCIRIFTANSVECSEMVENPVVMVGKPSEMFESLDGSPFSQVQSMEILGDWTNRTADGCDEKRRMQNQKYILTIPENRKEKFVFQLSHNVALHKDIHCRLDIFEIDADVNRENKRWMILHRITKKTTFIRGVSISYEYELKSGKYLLLPNYLEKEGIKCEYCIRILSNVTFDCREVNQLPIIFERRKENVFEYTNQHFSLSKTEIVFGEWIQNVTAGGQISHKSFYRNPQYDLFVGGVLPQPVLISLLQELVDPIYAIGCQITEIHDDENISMNCKSLRGSEIKTIEGKSHSFVRYHESSGFYVLNPGRYLVLVHADKPTDEKRFALLVAAQPQTTITLKTRR